MTAFGYRVLTIEVIIEKNLPNYIVYIYNIDKGTHYFIEIVSLNMRAVAQSVEHVFRKSYSVTRRLEWFQQIIK